MPYIQRGVLLVCGLALLAAVPVLAQNARLASPPPPGVSADTSCPAWSCPLAVPPAGTLVLPAGLSDLPVDRVADLLALEPGVASLEEGDLTVRGAGTDALAGYIDGVPVTPGRRAFHTALLGGSWFGERGSGLAIGTNAFDRLTLLPGFTPASRGGAVGGVVDVSTARSTSVLPDGTTRRVGARGSWATDAVFGTGGGLDFNRVRLDAGARTPRLDVSIAGIAEGQGTARLGLDQNASPVYLAAGVDTTVTVTRSGTQTSVDVLKFTPSEGLRIPGSAVSAYTVMARGSYRVADGQDVELTLLGSQAQQREFDYENLYNSAQLRADRAWSRAVIGGWRGRLMAREGLALTGEAHLSWQTDREIDGPLTPSAELDSRSPFGGFLLAPLGFRFDFDNFAVNNALVNNFRTNSGRLTPYDLNNNAQYQLVDQWRSNAYAVAGFSEGGGPVGLLTLARENRTVGSVALEARIGSRHRLRVGAEHTGYEVNYYSSQLLSQVLADAYIESPSVSALYADYTLTLDRVRAEAGVRYDRFSSDAARPAFPRISTAPGFDPADPTAHFVADDSHARVSPRLRVTGDVTDQVTLFGAVTALAQVPDFSAIYTGINTDLSTTSTQQPYGSDLDFERATLGELGARASVDPATMVEGTAWFRGNQRRTALRASTEFDSLRLANIDLNRFLNVDPGSASGLDLKLSRRLGRSGQAWLGYGYVDAADQEKGVTRPHTLTGAVLYRTGPRPALAAGLLRDAGIYGAFRIASGTSYTRCAVSDPANDGVITPAFCNAGIAGNIDGARLPTLKVLDLRVTKSFPLGGATLTAFVDARNLLNARNIIRVFTQTGGVSNAQERAFARVGYIQSVEAEAAANGALLSDSTVDLSFGGAQDPRTGCGAWNLDSGASAPPNCVYLIAAEERFGNGDHLFTRAEQLRASDAYYDVSRGLQAFTAPGRRVRFGVGLSF
jgi:hypothetical protein